MGPLMTYLHRPLIPLRRIFRWSNSIQTWQERIGDLMLISALVVASVCSIALGLTWWEVLGVFAFCLLLCFPLSAKGWLKIFGPVLYYDMIRQARRSRFAVLRFVYVLVLVLCLYGSTNQTTRQLGSVDVHQGAKIAEYYFEIFMLAQFAMAMLLTPAYVAGSVAEEKERGTLEFMLSTDLLNREIVLSKLASRLANLALMVLAGLPILSILQFLGGVDPNLVWAGFAVTAMTIFGVAGVGILCSVQCRRPREAISLAYLAIVLYYAVSLGLVLLTEYFTGIGTEPIWFGQNPPTFADALDIILAGNLVKFIIEVRKAGNLGTLASVLPDLVRDFAIFYGVVGFGCAALAIARVRRAGLIQSQDTRAILRGARRRLRPRLGLDPMLWREYHVETGGRSVVVAIIIAVLVLAATFVPAAIILWQNWFPTSIGSRRFDLAEDMNRWVRIATVVAGCLTMLAVAVRASTSVTSERDKQTLDTLLTTPLSSNEILRAKWSGSLLAVRSGMIWLMMIWLLGLLTGGLHIIALPILMVTWMVYAGFAAALGMWFSTVSRSSARATVLSILVLIALSGGHWMVWMFCGLFRPVSSADFGILVPMTQAGVFTPPFVMGFFAFYSRDLHPSFEGVWNSREMAGLCMQGLIVWSCATVALYWFTTKRFQAVIRRGTG
jgi:ABC-type transport system involved in multi-copper enzyme maturation permease subunit